ncbi:MAG: hypothetical protein ACKVX9_07235 [Blastocatellia bacterium]
MTPKIHRFLGIVYCLLAAGISVWNLNQTGNIGLKLIPAVLLILGVLQFARARKIEQKQRQ